LYEFDLNQIKFLNIFSLIYICKNVGWYEFDLNQIKPLC